MYGVELKDNKVGSGGGGKEKGEAQVSAGESLRCIILTKLSLERKKQASWAWQS